MKTMRARQVYLPAGADWYNFPTGQKVSGGQTLTGPSEDATDFDAAVQETVDYAGKKVLVKVPQ